MGRTDRIDVVRFHHLQIFQDRVSRNGASCVKIDLLTVSAADHELLPVDLRLLLSGLIDIHLADFTETDTLACRFHDISFRIFQLDGQPVQVRVVRKPKLRSRHFF